MRRQGFTLVELLTVVAVIALLLAVLLPSLGKAREVARMVRCLTQQRQVATYALTYAADFRGVIPQASTSGSQGQWWWGFYTGDDYAALRSDALRCPQNSAKKSGFSGVNYAFAQVGDTSPGFVGDYVPGSLTRFAGFRVSLVTDPVTFILASDSATQGGNDWNLANPNRPGCGVAVSRGGRVNRGGCMDYIWSCHGDNLTNMIFMDGHAASCSHRALYDLGVRYCWNRDGINQYGLMGP